MWSNARADAAHRELLALQGSGLDVDMIHEESLAIVATVVPFDAACMGAVDPETLALTSGVTVGFEPSAAESDRFTELEYGTYDTSSFASLVDQRITVAHDPLAPIRRRGARFNELSRALGFTTEVRMTFMVDGDCWAVGDVYRGGPSRDFDERELAFLRTANVAVAAATRAAMTTGVRGPGAAASGALPEGPAVMIVSSAGEVRSMTGAADDWLHALSPADAARARQALTCLVALVAAGMPAAHARARIGRGWVVVRASTLATPTARAERTSTVPAGTDIVVTIDAATRPDLVELMVRAHGLSRRERDVVHEVLAGRSTVDIAQQLFISTNTVQDHLKSIFAKTGMRTRRDLVAHLGAA